MLRICNKLETYHPKGETIDQAKHGHDGPIHISDGGYRGKSEDEFCATVQKMGYKVVEDLQDFDECGAFSVSCLLSPALNPNYASWRKSYTDKHRNGTGM